MDTTYPENSPPADVVDVDGMDTVNTLRSVIDESPQVTSRLLKYHEYIWDKV